MPATAVVKQIPVARMRLDELICYLCLFALPLYSEFVEPLPVPAHMIPTTILLIYLGSQSALLLAQNAVDAADNDGMDSAGQPLMVPERMETKDAYMFPLVGSCVLFSLYCVYKFLPKDYVNIVIKGYFFLFGVLVLQQKVRSLLAKTLPVDSVRSMEASRIAIPLPGFCLDKKVEDDSENKPSSRTPKKAKPVAPVNPEEDCLVLTIVDGIALVAAVIFGVWYLKENHWMANNILGFVFSLQGIEMLALGSFFNGVVLLCGLFIYDIFWVFGTEVMVTVAKSFDAPIKLLFPRGPNAEGEAQRPSMLGLGDIVIPGIFIALMLRYDLRRYQTKQLLANENKGRSTTRASTAATVAAVSTSAQQFQFPRTFFLVNLVCYTLGLAGTVAIMFFFQAAQPALLYLVPACLGGALLTALVTGELSALWNFQEDELGGGDDDDAKKIQ
jgi:minor histocompatibility antigen H13